MSLTATLTLLAAALAHRGERGMFGGVGVVMLVFVGGCRDAPVARRSTMPSSFIAPATARPPASSRCGPIAPMQPTRNVSTCVSLPG